MTKLVDFIETAKTDKFDIQLMKHLGNFISAIAARLKQKDPTHRLYLEVIESIKCVRNF